MTNLFKPVQVGKDTVSARIALSPMTRLRAPNAVPSDEVVEFYRQRAAAYPGSLLITEGTQIAPEAVAYPIAPGIWSEEQIAAWKKVTDAVHDTGSYIYCQIWAVGRIADSKSVKTFGDFDVVGPSAIAMKGGEVPKALTEADIERYIGLYAKAAENAIKAGFDGVEIHGANGYLVDQFLHANSNQRTDKYGGSIENRSRFALDIVDAVSKAVGPERTAIRFSPWGDFQDMEVGTSTIPQFSHVVSEIQRRAEAGREIAYIHLMEPRIDLIGDSYGDVERELNDFVHHIWKGVLIRCGAFGKDVDEMKQLTDTHPKLILAVGRWFNSNPDLIRKLKEGAKLEPYDRSKFYWDGTYPMAEGYTRDYVRKA